MYVRVFNVSEERYYIDNEECWGKWRKTSQGKQDVCSLNIWIGRREKKKAWKKLLHEGDMMYAKDKKAEMQKFYVRISELASLTG